jgi:hypothetical protein
MQTRIDSFFTRDVRAFDNRLNCIEQSLDPSAPVLRDAAYDDLCQSMREMVEACRRLESAIAHEPDLLRDTQRRFYDATAHWFDLSWVGQRARSKPRGYPGDYLLLNTIYDHIPKSPGLGGRIDLFIMDLLLANSVRARWQAIRRFLIEELSHRQGQVNVLNVACGPTREYVGGFNGAGARLRVTCLDNDPEALEFVSKRIRPQAEGMEINCQRYNALRMKSAEATRRLFGASDVIYSIGLCDYLTDSAMIGILEGWRKSLAGDGVLLVAFKDGPRYDKIEYQWLLDWHFFQRTEDDCRSLFQQAGFDMQELQMTRDATGVIMNFVARAKTAPSRIDDAHRRSMPHVNLDALPSESPNSSPIADA